VRKWFTDKSTIGELYIGNRHECFTLEDTTRKDGVKIHGKTAIPPGRYEIVINESPRFKKELPLLLNVQNFSGVRIHVGNYPEETEACILVGKIRPGDPPDVIYRSNEAMNQLMPKLRQMVDHGKLYISIS